MDFGKTSHKKSSIAKLRALDNSGDEKYFYLVNLISFAGSVWIFSLHNMMSTNPSSPFFCDPTIVMFGLYVTSITWVLLGIAGIYFAFRFFC